jgi:hypothetical protein
VVKKNVLLLILLFTTLTIAYLLTERNPEKLHRDKIEKWVEETSIMVLPKTVLSNKNNVWINAQDQMIKAEALKELSDYFISFSNARVLKSKAQSENYFSHPLEVKLMKPNKEVLTFVIGDMVPTYEAFYLKTSLSPHLLIMDLDFVPSPVVGSNQLDLQVQKFDRLRNLIQATPDLWLERNFARLSSLGSFSYLSWNGFSQTYHPEGKVSLFERWVSEIKNLEWVEVSTPEQKKLTFPYQTLDFFLGDKKVETWFLTTDDWIFIDSKKLFYKINRENLTSLFFPHHNLHYFDPEKKQWSRAQKIDWNPKVCMKHFKSSGAKNEDQFCPAGIHVTKI